LHILTEAIVRLNADTVMENLVLRALASRFAGNALNTFVLADFRVAHGRAGLAFDVFHVGVAHWDSGLWLCGLGDSCGRLGSCSCGLFGSCGWDEWNCCGDNMWSRGCIGHTIADSSALKLALGAFTFHAVDVDGFSVVEYDTINLTWALFTYDTLALMEDRTIGTVTTLVTVGVTSLISAIHKT